MDAVVLNFIRDNIFSLLGSVFLLVPFIPAKYANRSGYEFSKSLGRYAPPWSILRFLARQGFEVFDEFAMRLGLKGSITIVLFIVVFMDLLGNGFLSSQTVLVIIVAVISLYLEHMVSHADQIEFFGVFKYKRKSVPTLPPAPSE